MESWMPPLFPSADLDAWITREPDYDQDWPLEGEPVETDDEPEPYPWPEEDD